MHQAKIILLIKPNCYHHDFLSRHTENFPETALHFLFSNNWRVVLRFLFSDYNASWGELNLLNWLEKPLKRDWYFGRDYASLCGWTEQSEPENMPMFGSFMYQHLFRLTVYQNITCWNYYSPKGVIIRDFVTAATSLAEGETAIPAVLGDRKKKTVKKFLKTIPKRLGKTVRGVCSDMYDGFIRAAEEVSGKRTGIIIGRFHVARLYRNDLDRFRRKEMRRLKKELPEEEYRNLKGAVWALRKNGRKPSEEDRQVLKCLFGYSPESETAYSFCAQLADIFEDDISKSEAGRKIRIRKIQVRPSGLKCFDKFLKTLEKRFEGITNYFISRQTSGFAEGLNNKIKAIKRRCCGITSIGQLFRRIFPDLRGYSLFA